MPDHPKSEETPLGVFQVGLFCMILCNLNLPRLCLRLFPLVLPLQAQQKSLPYYALPSSIDRTNGNSLVKGGLDEILGKNNSLKG